MTPSTLLPQDRLVDLKNLDILGTVACASPDGEALVVGWSTRSKALILSLELVQAVQILQSGDSVKDHEQKDMVGGSC